MKWLITVLLAIVWVYASAQFTPLYDTGIVPTYQANITVGDFNQDGEYDIFVSGAQGNNFGQVYVNLLYLNLGSGYVNSGQSFAHSYRGGSACGDLDNDGDLDIVITGAQGVITYGLFVYRNEGNAVFTLAFISPLGLTNGSIELGDYDGDGDLDILETGVRVNEGFTKLLRNDGNFSFTEVPHPFPDVQYGSATWIDYDDDGDLDVSITGQLNHAPWRITRIYNNHNGIFTDSGIVLPALNYSLTEWTDLDSNGTPDLLLMGYDGVSRQTKMYLNDGNGVFTPLPHNLPNMSHAQARFGDYNQDGKPDLVWYGFDGSEYIGRVFRNDDLGLYASVQGITGLSLAGIAWMDYDRDEDLDVFITGFQDGYGDSSCYIYINNIPGQNNQPTAPQTVSHSGGEGLLLSWGVGNDNETHQQSLTYRVRMGTSSGGCEVISPGSDYETGFLYNPTPGTYNRKVKLNQLPTGMYYYAVQAVDGAFCASEWSVQQSFACLAPNDALVSADKLTIISNETSPYILIQQLAVDDPSAPELHNDYYGDQMWLYRFEADNGIAGLSTVCGVGRWRFYIYNGGWITVFTSPVEIVTGTQTFLMPEVDFSAKGIAYLLVTRDDNTLPVELGNMFAVSIDNTTVQLSWITHSETNLLGWRVYRAEHNNLPESVMMTPVLIDATNSSQDTWYHYTDNEIVSPAEYWYWVQAVSSGYDEYYGPVYVKLEINEVPDLPELSKLGNAHPNPFTNTTSIDITIKENTQAELCIYNLKGQRVKAFTFTAGEHQFIWDGRDDKGMGCATGIYLYRLSSESYSETKRMLYLGTK